VSPIQWQLLGLAAMIFAVVFLAVVGILFAIAMFYGGSEERS
jgi:heme/copper-type cytochrome/quinol oxidase subunit 2